MKFKPGLIFAKHPEILVGMGIAGMGASVIFAVRATPKALRLIEEKGAHTVWEKTRAAGPCYIPSALMFIASTGCIIGANSVHVRRNAALAAAYSISESTFREYSEKVVQEIGKGKEQKIRDAVAKDAVQKDPVESKEVIITGNGDSLCYDSISGRYFETSVDKIRKIENELNKRMLSELFISLNDFYYEAGLEPMKETGDDLGWNVENGLIDFGFSSQLATDGRPCLVLLYRTKPQYNYQYFG